MYIYIYIGETVVSPYNMYIRILTCIIIVKKICNNPRLI